MNKFKLIIAVTIYFFLVGDTTAQQPQTEWIQRFNSPGNYNEDLMDMALDKYGNIYLTGNTGNPTDIITLKYSTNGNLLWSKIYNGPANREDKAVKIAVDDSGFVYVAGETFSLIEFNNYLTIKYSSKGDLIWNREFNFGDSTTDVPHDMIIDSFSNIYITGYGSTCLKCSSDFMTVKSDKNGILQWVKNYRDAGDAANIGWELICDTLGRAIVSGRSTDVNNNTITATIIYDSKGNQTRVIKYDSSYVNTAIIDLNNNIYLGGFKKTGQVHNTYDIFVNKYNGSGDLIYNIAYNSSNAFMNFNDYLDDMRIDDKNTNLYVTGNSDFNGEPGWEYVLLKYNLSDGDSVWQKGYSPMTNSSSYAENMSVDKYDNVYMTGYSDYNTPYNRILTIKYDSSGNLIWAATYVNVLFFNHFGKRVEVDSSNSVYVGGTSYGPDSGTNDIILIKYSQITQVQSIPNLIPNEIKLFQNYPNPFNPITNIKYQVTKRADVKISVFNVLGNEVAVLVNENQNPGVYDLKLDASNYSSGIYFYRMKTNGNIFDTKN